MKAYFLILSALLGFTHALPNPKLKDNEEIVYIDESHIEIAIHDETPNDVSRDAHPFHRELLEGRRKLSVVIDVPHTKSQNCKKDCIDENLYYCPMHDFKWGNCCNPAIDVYNCPVGATTYDPRYAMDVNWCSNHNDARQPPQALKYLVCPNEQSCGGGGMKFMTPSMNEEVLTREMETRGLHKFVKDDVCAFVIKNPDNMGWQDWMWLQIDKQENVAVSLLQAYDYHYEGRGFQRVWGSKRFAMLRGKQYYVIAEADAIYPGNFRMQIWIEKHIQPAKPPPAAPKAPTISYTIASAYQNPPAAPATPVDKSEGGTNSASMEQGNSDATKANSTAANDDGDEAGAPGEGQQDEAGGASSPPGENEATASSTSSGTQSSGDGSSGSSATADAIDAYSPHSSGATDATSSSQSGNDQEPTITTYNLNPDGSLDAAKPNSAPPNAESQSLAVLKPMEPALAPSKLYEVLRALSKLIKEQSGLELAPWAIFGIFVGWLVLCCCCCCCCWLCHSIRQQEARRKRPTPSVSDTIPAYLQLAMKDQLNYATVQGYENMQSLESAENLFLTAQQTEIIDKQKQAQANEKVMELLKVMDDLTPEALESGDAKYSQEQWHEIVTKIKHQQLELLSEGTAITGAPPRNEQRSRPIMDGTMEDAPIDMNAQYLFQNKHENGLDAPLNLLSLAERVKLQQASQTPAPKRPEKLRSLTPTPIDERDLEKGSKTPVHGRQIIKAGSLECANSEQKPKKPILNATINSQPERGDDKDNLSIEDEENDRVGLQVATEYQKIKDYMSGAELLSNSPYPGGLLKPIAAGSMSERPNAARGQHQGHENETSREQDLDETVQKDGEWNITMAARSVDVLATKNDQTKSKAPAKNEEQYAEPFTHAFDPTQLAPMNAPAENEYYDEEYDCEEDVLRAQGNRGVSQPPSPLDPETISHIESVLSKTVNYQSLRTLYFENQAFRAKFLEKLSSRNQEIKNILTINPKAIDEYLKVNLQQPIAPKSYQKPSTVNSQSISVKKPGQQPARVEADSKSTSQKSSPRGDSSPRSSLHESQNLPRQPMNASSRPAAINEQISPRPEIQSSHAYGSSNLPLNPQDSLNKQAQNSETKSIEATSVLPSSSDVNQNRNGPVQREAMLPPLIGASNTVLEATRSQIIQQQFEEMPLSEGAATNEEEKVTAAGVEIEAKYHSEVEEEEPLKDQMEKEQKPGEDDPADEQSQEKSHSKRMESDAGWHIDQEEDGVNQAQEAEDDVKEKEMKQEVDQVKMSNDFFPDLKTQKKFCMTKVKFQDYERSPEIEIDEPDTEKRGQAWQLDDENVNKEQQIEQNKEQTTVPSLTLPPIATTQVRNRFYVEDTERDSQLKSGTSRTCEQLLQPAKGEVREQDEDPDFSINGIEDEFGLESSQLDAQNRIRLQNFDIEKFKKQPCGKQMLEEYEIDSKEENEKDQVGKDEQVTADEKVASLQELDVETEDQQVPMGGQEAMQTNFRETINHPDELLDVDFGLDDVLDNAGTSNQPFDQQRQPDLPDFFPNESTINKTINQTAVDSESKFKKFKIKRKTKNRAGAKAKRPVSIDADKK